MAGPITRDRFICTDCSDTAGEVGPRTRVGRIAAIAGALNELPTPMADAHDDGDARGIARRGQPRKDDGQDELLELGDDQELAAVDDVREHASDGRHEQQRPSCAKNRTPTKTADPVSSYPNAPRSTFCIHADVRREGPAPEDAESRFRSAACAVPRRNPTSPSMIASVASSACGSCPSARRPGVSNPTCRSAAYLHTLDPAGSMW